MSIPAMRETLPIITTPNRLLSVAPMMTHTDRHFRFFLRLLSRHVMLYTEMVTTGALIHGDAVSHIAHHQDEYPVGLQLGGSNPAELAHCARLGEAAGYQEINLNVGCPSDRVKSGAFGACLMAHPELVAECVHAMQAGLSIPVTVKSRIGIDDKDSYEELAEFISRVAEAGCRTFIIHARKAWLQGLSPRQNREIPPLQYETVHRVKRDFPHLQIIINGGVTTLEQAADQLQRVDGVMIGRAICSNPYLLAEADRRFYGDDHEVPDRFTVLNGFMDYIGRQQGCGVPFSRMVRNILGLFQGQPGARAFRRFLSESMYRADADITILRQAQEIIIKASTQAMTAPI